MYLSWRSSCRASTVCGLLLVMACKAGEIKDPGSSAAADPIPEASPTNADPNASPNPTDNQACTACHGSASDPAPPKDTLGNTATTFKGVGAHAAHLKDGTLRVAIACNECHTVPLDVSSAGHIDSPLPAEVIFGSLASIGNQAPQWNGTSCSQVYCHGGAFAGNGGTSGGTNNTPQWTGGSTQATCGSCHGLPPPAPHPAFNMGTDQCSTCHSQVVSTGTNPSNLTIINKALHINGEVNANDVLTCTGCHGNDANGNNAPPKALSGSTSVSDPGVGAHQVHLKGSSLANAFACSECHKVPSATNSPGHYDLNLPLDNQSPADFSFGPLATHGGASPSYSAGTCASTYCHGRFSGGVTTNAPTWTGGAAQAACGSCHAIAPATGDHNRHRGENCADCHGTGYSRTTVSVNLHVNGLDDVGGRGSSINGWNATTRSCSPTCHSSETW